VTTLVVTEIEKNDLPPPQAAYAPLRERAGERAKPGVRTLSRLFTSNFP